MDDSHRHGVEDRKPDMHAVRDSMRQHAVRLHFYQVQELVQLNDGDRKQFSSYLWRGLTGKGARENFMASGYMEVIF